MNEINVTERKDVIAKQLNETKSNLIKQSQQSLGMVSISQGTRNLKALFLYLHSEIEGFLVYKDATCIFTNHSWKTTMNKSDGIEFAQLISFYDQELIALNEIGEIDEEGLKDYPVQFLNRLNLSFYVEEIED